METSEFLRALVIFILTVFGGGGGGGAAVAVWRQTKKRKVEIADLLARADEQAAFIKSLQEDGEEKDIQIASNKAKMEQLERDFADAQKRVEEQSTLIDLHEKTISKYDKRLTEAHDTVARELSRADKADGVVGELRAEIVVLDKREDKSNSKVIDITMRLRDRNAECLLTESENEKLNARIAELLKPPPPPPPKPPPIPIDPKQPLPKTGTDG